MPLTPREARNAYAQACRHGSSEEQADAKRQLAVAVIAASIQERLADTAPLTPSEGATLRALIRQHTIPAETAARLRRRRRELTMDTPHEYQDTEANSALMMLTLIVAIEAGGMQVPAWRADESHVQVTHQDVCQDA